MDEAPLYEMARIERKDIKNRVMNYIQYTPNQVEEVELVKDIFSGCRNRKPRKRKAYITEIAESPAPYTPVASTDI
ncbi:MAG: hypothetical protein HOH03_02540 [Candidatus Marinimicrobia bacterium]|nr:hypothetical protein [Candidatus Neomarinimicrobiota bacterium]